MSDVTFFPTISSILLLIGIKMSYERSRRCQRGGVPFFFFPPLQHVLYSNLNLLLLENDSGEKLLLCWIIQTSSFRGVSGFFFPLQSLGWDNELCEQFRQVNRQLPGKHSLSLCTSVIEETEETKEERKVDISYWVSERRGRADQSKRIGNGCFFLSVFLSPDGERRGIDREG